MIKSILYLSILTTIIVVAWIFLEVYHNFQTPTIEEPTNIQITPIPSGFDTKVLEQIMTRTTVPVDLKSTLINPSISPSPTIAPVGGQSINQNPAAPGGANPLNPENIQLTPTPAGTL